MTIEPPIALSSPQILEIAGADAIAFAQAQFSSNVAELPNGNWQWSAWLSAQGRVRAFFHLMRDGDECLRLLLRGGSAAKLCAELAHYVFRAKARLRVIDQQHAYVMRHRDGSTGFREAPSGYRIEADGDDTCIALPGAPSRWLLLSARERIDAVASANAQNANALADIDAGLVTLDPALEDRLLPAWIGLDALGATSTNKGCYPGQEIVARLHFKGGNKRRLRRIEVPATALPVPGAVIGGTGEETMLVVCSAWASDATAAALTVADESATGAP